MKRKRVKMKKYLRIYQIIDGKKFFLIDIEPEDNTSLNEAKEAMTKSVTDEQIIKNARATGDGKELLQQPFLKPSSGSFLQKIPDSLFQFGAVFLNRQPRIDPVGCRGCGLCADICSQDAVKAVTKKDGKQVYKIETSKCITCFCCSEVCPYKAVITSLRGRIKLIFLAVRGLLSKEQTSDKPRKKWRKLSGNRGSEH